jgi:hypothetical protein
VDAQTDALWIDRELFYCEGKEIVKCKAQLKHIETLVDAEPDPAKQRTLKVQSGFVAKDVKKVPIDKECAARCPGYVTRDRRGAGGAELRERRVVSSGSFGSGSSSSEDETSVPTTDIPTPLEPVDCTVETSFNSNERCSDCKLCMDQLAFEETNIVINDPAQQCMLAVYSPESFLTYKKEAMDTPKPPVRKQCEAAFADRRTHLDKFIAAFQMAEQWRIAGAQARGDGASFETTAASTTVEMSPHIGSGIAAAAAAGSGRRSREVDWRSGPGATAEATEFIDSFTVDTDAFDSIRGAAHPTQPSASSSMADRIAASMRWFMAPGVGNSAPAPSKMHMYVVSLDGVPGAGPENAGRLAAFKQAWRAQCDDEVEFTWCPGVVDNRRGYGLTNAFVGCIKRAIEDNAPRAYFFEDDARPMQRDFCSGHFRAELLDSSPSDALAVLVGGHTFERAAQSVDSGRYLPLQGSYGTYGFGARGAALPALLAGLREDMSSELYSSHDPELEMVSPDVAIHRIAASAEKRIYVTSPLYIKHSAGFSNTWGRHRPEIAVPVPSFITPELRQKRDSHSSGSGGAIASGSASGAGPEPPAFHEQFEKEGFSEALCLPSQSIFAIQPEGFVFPVLTRNMNSADFVAAPPKERKEDKIVSCPGLAASDYCDCGGDCTERPQFCSCAAAKDASCCGSSSATGATDTRKPVKDSDGFKCMGIFATLACKDAGSGPFRNGPICRELATAEQAIARAEAGSAAALLDALLDQKAAECQVKVDEREAFSLDPGDDIQRYHKINPFRRRLEAGRELDGTLKYEPNPYFVTNEEIECTANMVILDGDQPNTRKGLGCSAEDDTKPNPFYMANFSMMCPKPFAYTNTTFKRKELLLQRDNATQPHCGPKVAEGGATGDACILGYKCNVDDRCDALSTEAFIFKNLPRKEKTALRKKCAAVRNCKPKPNGACEFVQKTVPVYRLCDGTSECPLGDDEGGSGGARLTGAELLAAAKNSWTGRDGTKTFNMCSQAQCFREVKEEGMVTEEDKNKLIAIAKAANELTESPDGDYGNYATGVISGIAVLFGLVILFVLYAQAMSGGKYDITEGQDAPRPFYAVETFVIAFCFKLWNIIWEFKAIPIIVQQFYQASSEVFKILATAKLSELCLEDVSPTHRLWDTSKCDSTATAMLPGADAMATGAAGGFASQLTCPATPMLDKSGCERHMALTAKNLFGAYQNLQQEIAEGVSPNFNCQCMVESGAGSHQQYLDDYVNPMVYGTTALLATLLLSTLTYREFWNERFGTLNYFLAVSNSKRTKLYNALLFMNLLALIGCLIFIAHVIEDERKDSALTKEQYTTAYTIMISSFIVQMLGYTDLWTRIPPSQALEQFKDQKDVITVKHTGGSINLGSIGEIDVNWSWFNTAEDTLEVVEDGFLFYLFGRLYGEKSQASGTAADNETEILVTNSTDRGSYYVNGALAVEGLRDRRPDADSAPRKIGKMYERYLSQALSTRYWKGGTKLIVNGEDDEGEEGGFGFGT